MYLPVLSYCLSIGMLWSNTKTDPSTPIRIPEMDPNTYSGGPSNFPKANTFTTRRVAEAGSVPIVLTTVVSPTTRRSTRS
jgi:hypothetical protein